MNFDLQVPGLANSRSSVLAERSATGCIGAACSPGPFRFGHSSRNLVATFVLTELLMFGRMISRCVTGSSVVRAIRSPKRSLDESVAGGSDDSRIVVQYDFDRHFLEQ